MRSHPLEISLRKEGVLNVAGIDEAGRGPWAGPVVAAAAIIKPNVRISGLNDSKKLTQKQREALFGEILKKADVGIGVVSNKIIDKKGLAFGFKLAFKKAIDGLSVKPNFLLIDGIGKYDFGIEYKTVKKGDSCVRCIAAASIIAKVTRDTLMESYALKFPKYAFEEHKGYGTRKHRQNLLKYGTCKLHRTSFEPIKELINE